MAEHLHHLVHGGLASIYQLEDPPAHATTRAGPDPILLAHGERPGQALDEHRADLAQLARTPDLLDRHGRLLVVLAEVVVDPYPGAVRPLMPLGVEVGDVVADPALGVQLRSRLAGQLQPVVQAVAAGPLGR